MLIDAEVEAGSELMRWNCSVNCKSLYFLLKKYIYIFINYSQMEFGKFLLSFNFIPDLLTHFLFVCTVLPFKVTLETTHT